MNDTPHEEAQTLGYAPKRKAGLLSSFWVKSGLVVAGIVLATPLGLKLAMLYYGADSTARQTMDRVIGTVNSIYLFLCPSVVIVGFAVSLVGLLIRRGLLMLVGQGVAMAAVLGLIIQFALFR